MKKTILAIAAMAVMFGFAQCSKQPVQPHYTGYVGDLYVSDVTVGATKADNNNNSKVSPASDEIGAHLDLRWDATDQLYVFDDENQSCLYGEQPLTISDGIGTPSAKFDGTLISKIGDTLTFVYKGSEASMDGATCTENFQNQTGTMSGEGKSLMNILVLTGQDKYKENVSDYNMTMSAPYAVLKLDLSTLGTSSGRTVKVKVGEETIATVLSVTDTKKDLYVALPAAASRTYTFEGKITVTEEWKALDANTFYTSEAKPGKAIVIPSTPGLPPHDSEENSNAVGGH